MAKPKLICLKEKQSIRQAQLRKNQKKKKKSKKLKILMSNSSN
jgi:hypothetical protein